MKFSELLQKMMGLDETKEYDIVEKQPESNSQISTVEQDAKGPSNSNSSTAEQNSEPAPQPDVAKQNQEITNQIMAKDKTIEQLKAMNLALLSKTEANDQDTMSVEDRIYLAVYGNKKKSEE